MYRSVLKDFMGVWTNLTESQLEKVAMGIMEKRIVWDDSKSDMFSELSHSEFDFEGARYKYEEFLESPSVIELISAEPAFVQSIIDDHEKELTEVTGKRDYDKAKKINDKIENLQKLLLPV
jgi:hypothetical protein